MGRHVQDSKLCATCAFEEGAADQHGHIVSRSGGYAAHHDVITQPDQVQVYEAVIGDSADTPTRSLLGATAYLKDNRLLPRGFISGGPDDAHTAIRGEATRDGNYTVNGSGRDEVTYGMDLASAEGRFVAEVQLLYQSVPPEVVARFEDSRGSAAKDFHKMYQGVDKTPEIVNEGKLEF